MRDHRAEIRLQRRQLRRRTYRPGKPNVVWGMDGTGKTDQAGRTHFLLGIVDHGTRRCLRLKALPDKATITILRHLLEPPVVGVVGEPVARDIKERERPPRFTEASIKNEFN